MAELLDCPDCGAELQIEAAGDWQTMHRGAWCAADLSELLSSPALRGESKLIRGNDGRTFSRRRPDETTYSVPMVFSGAVDRNGNVKEPHDHEAQLETNRAWFEANIVEPSWTSALNARLLMPDGNTRTATVMCTFTWTVKPGHHALAVLSLTIPDAKFS